MNKTYQCLFEKANEEHVRPYSRSGFGFGPFSKLKSNETLGFDPGTRELQHNWFSAYSARRTQRIEDHVLATMCTKCSYNVPAGHCLGGVFDGAGGAADFTIIALAYVIIPSTRKKTRETLVAIITAGRLLSSRIYALETG